MIIKMIAVIATIAFSAIPRYGQSGWEGYTWSSSARASVDFTVPNLTGTAGDSVAFWGGFGHGNPGIQQTGITGTVGSGYTAWWEMWANPGSRAHQFAVPSPPHSGDVMQFIVTRSGSLYTLTVADVTRHWSVSTRQSSADQESSGDAIAEAYGPTLPNFGPARFYSANGNLSGSYRFPFGGSTLRQTGPSSFYVSRP